MSQVIVDGAFTKLYCQWDAAGSDRFVRNCACYLAADMSALDPEAVAPAPEPASVPAGAGSAAPAPAPVCVLTLLIFRVVAQSLLAITLCRACMQCARCTPSVCCGCGVREGLVLQPADVAIGCGLRCSGGHGTPR